MSRPTIRDLAAAAGVSVATVNRVLAGSVSVSPSTRQLVQETARQIGFYGLGTIQSRVAASRPRLRLGALLLQPHRPFYQNSAAALRRAASETTAAEIDLRVEFLLAADCQVICLVSAVHPTVTEAVERIQSQGVHVFALVAQLSATGQVPYIGLDNWKVGRTAAWTFDHVCKLRGKLGILMGNPRYRNQAMNKAGFRSYFREHVCEFTLLEPTSTFEASAVAQEITERLLADHPDLAGLYVSGGGISGALAALRRAGKAGQIVTVGHDLTEITRAALLDGTVTLIISHPLERLAKEAIESMVGACVSQTLASNPTRIVPFDLFTRENP